MRAFIAVRLLMLAALATTIVSAGARRYARVGEMQGAPEVQVHASDAWRTGERNLPLIEASRIQSGPQDRIEIELDDGSLFRTAGSALAELSDYSQLSTGQRVTLVSLDHGVAYFTGEPRLHDTLSLALPGVQITLRQGSRVRLAAYEQSSSVAVLEGSVKFSTPRMEMELRAGQFLQVYSDAPDHFTLLREIPKLEADDWNEGRDKSTAHSTSATYIPGVGYGLSDLDRSGGWVQTPTSGMVWKPRTDAEWRPFRDGRWEWYDEAGYTWIARETWGWLPYHFGRWLEDASLGWVWSPDSRPNPIYKPGEVYWMRGAARIAWGPLAPSEVWMGTGRSQLYAPANSTMAPFLAGVRVIDPAKLDEKLAANPGEALAGMTFAVAPISPALSADRFEALRTELKTAETPARLVTSAEPQVPQAAYNPAPPLVEQAAASIPATPPLAQMADSSAPGPDYDAPGPLETYIPVPVYSGIVVVDPPLWDERAGRMGNPPAGSAAPGKGPTGSGNSGAGEPPHHESAPVRLPEPPHETRKETSELKPASN